MALSNRDKNLIEAFLRSCRYETVPDSSMYLHADDVYCLHKYAFLIRPADDKDKASMKPDKLYPAVGFQGVKQITDLTRCDPSISVSNDGVEIPDIRHMKDTEFLITKAGTGGSQASFLYFLQDKPTHKEVTGGVNIEGSSLSVLPMRPYTFRAETMDGNYDGCTFELHVFFPLNAPIVAIKGDVVRLYCATCTDFKDILYKPVLVNGSYYKLDGWRHSQTPGSSTYQYFKKLKGKEIMNLPKLGSPIKNAKPTPPAQTVAPPADTTPLEAAAAEAPAAPPVRPLPKRRPAPAPAPAPAPEPAGAPGDSVTVEELQQRQAEEPQVETFEQPVNAMEQPMEDPAEPVTVAEEQTDIPKAQATQPDREMTQAEYAALKKRTRKPAPVVPVGFDFGPVLEYTGSALPEDLTADQIEAEARSLRDLGINVQRRLTNLLFAMRKTGSASEAKLKALSELLGK